MNCGEEVNCTALEKEGMPNFHFEHFFLYLNAITVVVGIFGIFFNIISMYIYTRPIMQSAINILLTGVSCIDLVFLVLMVVVYSCMVHVHYMVPESPNTLILTLLAYLRIFCYPIIAMLHSASIWTLTLISAERYIAVCMPFRARQICTDNKSKMALALVCLVSAFFNVSRFWEFHLQHDPLGVDPPNVTEYLLHNTFYKVIHYNGLNILFNFVLPFTFIFYANFSIIRAILSRRHQRKRLSTKEVREHSTAFMMMWVIVLFVMCYTLLNVVYMLEILKVSYSETIEGIVVFTGDMLIVVHTSTTWIIYYWFGQKYRTFLRDILWQIFHCKPSGRRSCSNATSFLNLQMNNNPRSTAFTDQQCSVIVEILDSEARNGGGETISMLQQSESSAVALHLTKSLSLEL